MKYIFLIFSLFFLKSVFSQLIIDAGNDTTFCIDMNNPGDYSIGGSPTVLSGTPPYTYTWTIKEPYQLGSNFLHADVFLSDTTIANPAVVDGFGLVDSMYFFLQVEDNAGFIAKDSILIRLSTFGLSLDFFTYNIYSGDSLFLNWGSQVGGGLGSLSYLWQPTHGLIDSTSNVFWAYPTQSVNYYCIVTDAFGCSITTPIVYYINVHYLSVDELLETETTDFIAYPNPTTGEFYLDLNEKRVDRIQIFDVNMRLMDEVAPPLASFDMSNYAKGTYFIQFEYKGKLISRKIVLQ
jgi:hypothetical protein